jgi:hypothetical protein
LFFIKVTLKVHIRLYGSTKIIPIMETNMGVKMVVSARAAASLFLHSGQGLKISDGTCF